MKTKWRRTRKKIVDDGILMDYFADVSMRVQALVCVLRRLPHEEYKNLLSKWGEFGWFIPPEDELTFINPFAVLGGGSMRAVYLAPQLEKQNFKVLIGFVACSVGILALDFETDPSNRIRRRGQLLQVSNPSSSFTPVSYESLTHDRQLLLDEFLEEAGFEPEVKAMREYLGI